MSSLREQLQSTLGSTYTIERELGGGMARVFVAYEVALDRRVVLKMLHPDLQGSVSVDRFRREILVAARLLHPNVVPLLSAGECLGLPFYTMPFISGESLRVLLDREGQLAVDHALRLAREIAEALQYAHEQGLVHRDIKPENVLLHNGRALVTDFGIARAITAASTETTLTQPGMAIGTVAYMSPEQLFGEKTIDGRADIYSLGCVLFEMLTGSAPYGDEPRQAVAARHIADPIPSARLSRGEVSETVDQIIQRSLAKSADGRFAGATEFVQGLDGVLRHARQSRPTPSPPKPRTIAVLPFANISGDPSKEYFSDGITEELITALSRNAGGMRVIARTSVFVFKGQNRDIREICSILGATHAVEGSVRMAGRRLRANAQLVDGSNGSPLWSERFDRDVEDVFAVQDEITNAIVGRLRRDLDAREEPSIGLLGASLGPVPRTAPSPAAPQGDARFGGPRTRKPQVETKPCSLCGSPVAIGAMFCPTCGNDVSAAQLADGYLSTVAEAPDAEGDLLALAKKHLGEDYRIEEELGRGGMAVVYKAVEIFLERYVAIKVVPPEFVTLGHAADRFRREAKLAISLSHPNILPVYRVGQAGPLYYLSMKFVEGRSLDRIIERQGALPLPVCVAILRYSAMGLAFAHERKVVHRDIKPGNILVDKDGRVMVSDFGLARALSEGSETAPGMLIGTPYYMSPEQCGGQKVVPQSDQYSLGIVGFQMLTGEVPFLADSMVGVIQHHYMTPVPDIRAVRSDVPTELVDIICCSLNKDPLDRFPTTKDMAVALENVPLSDEDRAEADALLRKLSAGQAIPKVRVASLPPLSLTISGPGPKAQPRSQVVAMPAPDRQSRRASAQLPKAAPLRRKHSTTVLATIGSLLMAPFALIAAPFVALARLLTRNSQEDVSPRESDQEETLALTLSTGVELEKPADRFPAYDAYLRGRFLLNFESTEASLREAIAQLDIAIAGDPERAAAFAARSYAYTMLARAGIAPDSLRDKAEADANKALALEPSLPEALLAKGLVAMFFDWDRAKAMSTLQSATSSTHAVAHLWHGAALTWLEGRPSDAIDSLDRAMDLDPLSIATHVELAFAHLAEGDVEQALNQADEAVSRGLALGTPGPRQYPPSGAGEQDTAESQRPTGFAWAHHVRAVALGEVSRLDEALVQAEEAVRVSDREVSHLALLGALRAKRDDRAGAQEILDELVARGKAGYAVQAAIATVYAGAQAWDSAIMALHGSRRAREPAYLFALGSTHFAPLSSDPRWAELVDRVFVYRDPPRT